MQKLIYANELVDIFLYGVDDMAVLGDQELDAKVIDIIRQQPEAKAVPYCDIARAILKIREINANFEYVKRQDVIDIMWSLIDEKPKKEAAEQ